MEPLHIAAHLGGQVAIPSTLAIDGLLAWAVATRDGLPPLDAQDDPPTIEIPVAREPGGRFHLASFGVFGFEGYETRWVNRRYPVDVAQALGEPALRRLRVSRGPSK